MNRLISRLSRNIPREDSRARVLRFYGGNLVSYSASVNVKPSSQIAFELEFAHSRAAVPVGAFTADITSLRTSYSFSTRLSTNLLLQYNSFDNTVSANFRLNFIHHPGSDIFLVITEERGDETPDIWDLSHRSVVAKITYLSRF